MVTNIESDHLDFFGSPDAYVAVFDSFVERLAPGGALVVCMDDPGAAALAEAHCRAGDPGAALRVCDRSEGPTARLRCWPATLLSWEQQGTGAVAHVKLAGEIHPRVMRLAVPGRHMALNALGALVAAIEIGAPVDGVLDGLAGFEGVRRRFELIGTGGRSVRVFDDYAHHPTEISATLEAVRTRAGAERRAADRWWCFSPIYIRGQRLSLPNSVARWTLPTRFSCSTSMARASNPLAGVSGASVAEHVSVPVRYLPDFSAVADAGGRGRWPGRRHRHDGRRRRDHAGAGDRDRAAGAGQPQRAGSAGGVAVTEPNSPTEVATAEPGRRTARPNAPTRITEPIDDGASRKTTSRRKPRASRGSAAAGAPGTCRAPRRAGPRDRDRGGAPRGQTPGPRTR